MPYASKAQQRKFHSDPRLRKYAKEYDDATDFSKLPERIRPTRNRTPRTTPGGIADRLSQAARNRAKLRSRRRSSRTRGR